MARLHAQREGTLLYNSYESQGRCDDVLDGLTTVEEARRDCGVVIARRDRSSRNRTRQIDLAASLGSEVS
jgi:hypothetical protein